MTTFLEGRDDQSRPMAEKSKRYSITLTKTRKKEKRFVYALIFLEVQIDILRY